MRGDKQLFSSSIDGHVKLWDIRSSQNHVISAVNTWTHPAGGHAVSEHSELESFLLSSVGWVGFSKVIFRSAGVTALCVTCIAGQVRIFATCQVPFSAIHCFTKSQDFPRHRSEIIVAQSSESRKTVLNLVKFRDPSQLFPIDVVYYHTNCF